MNFLMGIDFALEAGRPLAGMVSLDDVLAAVTDRGPRLAMLFIDASTTAIGQASPR